MSKTIEEIGKLAEMLKQYDLGEISIKDGDFELCIKGKAVPAPIVVAGGAAAPAAVSSGAPVLTASAEVSAAAPAADGNVMLAPIIGTFYNSPAPDKPAFVKVGDRVKKGDILFIIESMKLMNEIPCEFDGTVSEILVSNAQGVEFHQPIMVIK